MKKIDFSQIDIDFDITSSKVDETTSFSTAENIEIKSIYTEDDLSDLKHLNFVSGLAPNLRGPYASMYTVKPWTIRQYAGFSTAEESNAFYRKNLAAGQ